MPKSKLRYKDLLREKNGGEVKRTAYSNGLIMVDYKKEKQDDSISDGINPLESARKLTNSARKILDKKEAKRQASPLLMKPKESSSSLGSSSSGSSSSSDSSDEVKFDKSIDKSAESPIKSKPLADAPQKSALKPS